MTNLDPRGTIVLGMGGLFDLGKREVGEICAEIVSRINARKPGLRNGQGEWYKVYSGSTGLESWLVRYRMREMRETKDEDPCWHEQIVLVGFSDGATSIWVDFNNGKYAGKLRSRHGGHYRIAYVGIIDLVRTSFWEIRNRVLDDPNKRDLHLTDGWLIGKGANFYQLNRLRGRPITPGQPRETDNPNVVIKWKGHPKIDPLASKEIFGVSHKGRLQGWPLLGADLGHILNDSEPPSILLDRGMRHALINEAVEAYLAKEPGGVRDWRDPLVD